MTLRAFALLGLLATTYPVCADELPWQSLEFEQRKLWVTASSGITLDYLPVADITPELASDVRAHPATTGVLRLQAASGVANSSEQMTLLMDADSLALYRKSRLSEGKERRLKQYQYLETGMLRTRIDPERGEEYAHPDTWSKRSQKRVAYPDALPDKAAVSSASALLLIASRTSLDQANASDPIYVQTDHNFYRAQLIKDDAQSVDSDFELDGKSVDGKRPVNCYRVETVAVGTLPDKPDFALMGLEGEIVICVDRETAIPLLVSGRAPRVGETNIRLIAARRAH